MGVRYFISLMTTVSGLAIMATHPTNAADIVIKNTRILTMDNAMPEAEAIAITDGQIVALGTTAEIAREIQDHTRVYDLPDALILPGFQDAHTHLIWSATELEDISLFDAETIADLKATISAGASASPDEPWVRGSGWDLSAFPGTLLDRTLLDELVPDRPAYFAAADGHSAWVNSKALEAAGINASTPDPKGGQIERGANNEPQGLLREAATSLVSDKMPPYSPAQVARGLDKALTEANGFGITSIIDAKADDWMLAGYQTALESGRLSVRVRAAVELLPDDSAAGIEKILALQNTYKDPMLSVNAAKIYIDGVIEAKTAAMLAPYTDDDSNGDLLFAQDALNQAAIALDHAGIQMHFHAIGDKAVRVSLDAIETAQTANGQRDRRPQLAHIEVIDPADIPRFSTLGAIANFQALWAYPDSYITDLTEPVIGPDRSEWLYPIAAVIEAGGTVAGGSDWSVSSMNPLEAIQVGVTRQDPEDVTGRVLTPQHRATLDQMLRAYTINAAYAGFRDTETGSLVVGKRADIVVLDTDITKGAATDISSAKTLLTLLDGKPVFTSPDLPNAEGH